MIENMDTLRRVTNVIQWDVSSKKRCKPSDGILNGEQVRVDKAHITAVGIGDAADRLRDSLGIDTPVEDDGKTLRLLKLGPTIAKACVPMEPLKQWFSALNHDNVWIHLKGGTVCFYSGVDGVDIACLVAERIERDD